MKAPALAAVGAVLLWSTNAFAAKYALADLTVLQLLTLQFGAATLALAAMRAVQRGPRDLAGGWPAPRHILVGLIGLTGTIFLQYLAFDLARIVEANVIAYAWPLFVAVWAAAVVRNLQARLGLLLAVIGFAGVGLIFDARGGLSFADGMQFGYIFAVASAACMAFYTVASSRIPVSGDRLMLPATMLGTITAFGLSLWQGTPWPAPAAWWTAVYIGVGPMAAGFGLWTLAMSGDGAKRLAPVGYGTPLLSTVLLLLSGESFTPQTLLGAAMVMVCSIGVLAADRLTRAKPVAAAATSRH
jgi:drug/metabolite transporter (DMT)-like permease